MGRLLTKKNKKKRVGSAVDKKIGKKVGPLLTKNKEKRWVHCWQKNKKKRVGLLLKRKVGPLLTRLWGLFFATGSTTRRWISLTKTIIILCIKHLQPEKHCQYVKIVIFWHYTSSTCRAWVLVAASWWPCTQRPPASRRCSMPGRWRLPLQIP